MTTFVDRARAADSVSRCTRSLFRPRVGSVVIPLAMVCGINSAVAADAPTGGSTSSPSSSAASPSAGSAGSGATGNMTRNSYNDTRPVETTSNYNPGLYAPSGAGTANPLGFAAGFAPNGCAPSLHFSDTATQSSASVLQRPSGPRRDSGRYVQISVGGSETYSDNINLDSDDNAESDFVTTVAPRVDACSSTGRIRGQGTYQLEGVVYAHNSKYNDVYNDAQGQTRIDLIENHLYLDANTEFGQRVIDPSIGYSRSNIIRPGENKTREWLTNISPFVVQSLGVAGQAMVRYRYGRTVYDSSNVPDTTVNGVSASLTSPAEVEPISWRLQAVTQTAKRTGGRDQDLAYFNRFRQVFGEDVRSPYADRDRKQHFDSATAQLGYRVTPAIKLTALGGVEDRYKRNGENDRWSSARWQVGAQWNGARNSLEVDYGHRFFGPSYALYARHQARFFDLSLSYQEQPSSPGLDSLNNVGSGYTYGSIGSLLGGAGYYNSNSQNGTTSLFDRGVYVLKRWQGRVGFNTALTRTTLTGYFQRRDYQTADVPNSTYYGAEIDTRYALGPRTSIVPSARWEHEKETYVGFETDDTSLQARSDSDNYDAGVSIVRAISPSAEGALGYARSWRNGSNGFDYHENRVTLQVRKAF